MSFSNLFTKLSDIKQNEPRPRNEDGCRSVKRRLQSPTHSHLKRQCLRSHSAHNDEEPTSSKTHHYWTRTRTRTRADPSARVSTARSPSDHQPRRRKNHNERNPNYAPGKKEKNKGREKRYTSSNRGRRDKHADLGPRKRLMTQEFKEQHAVELPDGRLLCKYFLLGRCTKGEACQLEHVEGNNDLIKKACKFYIQAACNRGAACPYMHMSIPCKYFHTKGWCSSDFCRFSHDPLTDCTRKVLEALVQRDQEPAEEPAIQVVDEELKSTEDLVTLTARPSFYQSSEAAVEDELSLPHNGQNEQEADVAEQNSAPQTQNNSDPVDSSPLDQPGSVCYSVEAVLGPKLFKPVLYSAPKPPHSTREESLTPRNAPYSVANSLRSQTGHTGQLFIPVPPAYKLENRAISATNDNASLSGNIGLQNVLSKISKQPSSFHVTDASEQCRDDGPSGGKLNCEANKTQTPMKLTPVAGERTAENTGTSSQNINKSKSHAWPIKHTLMTQQNLKETSESRLNKDLSHASQKVKENRQNLTMRASEKTTSSFSHLFENLQSELDKRLKIPDSFDQTLIPAAKPNDEIPVKSTHCNNQEGEIVSINPDHYNALSFSVKSPREEAMSGKTPAESFQSLFTSLDVDDKATKSGAEELEKSNCCTQEALNNQNAVFSLGKVDLCKPVFSDKSLKEEAKTTVTPAISFQSLFTSLDVEKPSTVASAFSDKPAVKSSAKTLDESNSCSQKAIQATVHRKSSETGPEISNRKTPGCSSAIWKNKQDMNFERDKISDKSFQCLFAAPLRDCTGKNDSTIGLKESLLSRVSEAKSSEVTTEERPNERKTVATTSLNVWTKASGREKPPHLHSSVFKTLFQRLPSYEDE